MIGQILFRRPAEHRPVAVGKVDLGYLFLPRAWGFGYAAEACAAALDWFDGVVPGEPVVLATQTANVASMRLAAKLGFTEVERFHACDADQWLGLRSPATPGAVADVVTATRALPPWPRSSTSTRPSVTKRCVSAWR